MGRSECGREAAQNGRLSKRNWTKTVHCTDAYISTFVEQPSIQRMTFRLYPSSVPPGVKDVGLFLWLTETPAPSDFCFFLFLVCYTNVLTYLLTYLLIYLL